MHFRYPYYLALLHNCVFSESSPPQICICNEYHKVFCLIETFCCYLREQGNSWIRAWKLQREWVKNWGGISMEDPEDLPLFIFYHLEHDYILATYFQFIAYNHISRNVLKWWKWSFSGYQFCVYVMSLCICRICIVLGYEERYLPTTRVFLPYLEILMYFTGQCNLTNCGFKTAA